MLNMGLKASIKDSRYYKWYVSFFFVMGIVSYIALFIVDWKVALPLFFLMWANNAFHSSIV